MNFRNVISYFSIHGLTLIKVPILHHLVFLLGSRELTVLVAHPFIFT